MKRGIRRLRWIPVLLAGVVLIWVFPRPRGNRAWSKEGAVLAQVTVSEKKVGISNIRDYTWTRDSQTPAYGNRTLSLDDLESVWLIVAPLSPARRGPAHLMLSFGWKGGDFITLSAEARREQGESYSPWRGLCRQYELIYVVSTERDAITLRTERRGVPVYLYPVRTTAEARQKLFLSMVERAALLNREPEFYNTLTNNCAQNIRRHVNALVDRPLGRSWKYILPGTLDEEAAARGLLDVALPLDRDAHLVRPGETGSPFSLAIRQTLPEGSGRNNP